MKHINILVKSLSGSLLALGLLASISVHGAQAQTASSTTGTTTLPVVTSTTTVSTATTNITATGTLNAGDLQSQVGALQAAINALQAQLNMVWQELSALLGGSNNLASSGAAVVSAPPTLTPSTVTVPASGTSVIDFNGRSFGREEQVTIAQNGRQIGTAHADSGGNFTTGSMAIPSAAGTYTYTFTGANSGTSLTSTVTVQ